MDEVTRLLLLIGVAGAAVTVLAGIARWSNDEGRRIRRGLKAILKGAPHGYLAALGRGKGLGFNFTSNRVAVAWDAGAWGLVYGLDELVGAEAIVDGVVVGRVHRGEQRLALNAFEATERVALRLVFDDLAHPDFVLDLWLPEDEGRRHELPPAEAIAEANRWLARIEALLRRPGARPAPTVARQAPAAGQDAEPDPPAAPAAELPTPARRDSPLAPLFSRLAHEEDPPWEEPRAAAPAEAEEDDDFDEEEDEEEEDEIRSLRL